MTAVDVATTFHALGDLVRRGIVEHLERGAATVGELGALFPISLQAVSKHIAVLERAGVVTRGKQGRTRPVRLERAAIADAADWMERRRRRLEERYQRLDALLATMEEEP